MTGEFPTHLARGITSSECVDGATIKKCVFRFSENIEERLREMSIQWLDNEESEQIAKNMLKRDKTGPKFGLGFAVIRTEDLEGLKKTEYYKDMSYCRAPTDVPGFYNPYHGHITLPLDARTISKQLASELALISKKYEYEEALPTDKVSPRNP